QIGQDIGQGPALDLATDDADDRFAETADRTADDDHPRVDDVDQVGDGDAEIGAGRGDGSECYFVALTSGEQHVVERESNQATCRQRLQRRARLVPRFGVGQAYD